MPNTSDDHEPGFVDDRPRLRPPLAPDPNPPPPPRFGMKPVFVLMAALAASLGLFRLAGAEGWSLLALWAITLPPIVGASLFPQHRVANWSAAFLLLLMLICLLLPTVQYTGEGGRRSQCANNMRNITLALLNYEAQHGSFPPAYVLGPDGKPWHSWRVLILPYIEQEVLYEHYRFDEPWNSPHNMQLAARMPSLFRCPDDTAQPPGSICTSYVAVVGPDTVWPDAKTTSSDSIPDGASNTLLIVEVTDSGIPWTQPADLKSAILPQNVGAAQGIRSEHVDGANVAVADGSVHFLTNSTTPQELRALLTAAGGEVLKNFLD